MKKIISVIIVLLIVILCSRAMSDSCSLKELGEDSVGVKQDIAGHYSSSFEHSGLNPCGKEKNVSWWVSAPKHFSILNEELRKLGGSKYEAPSKRVFIRAKACVSKPGSYGHMGAYPRLVEILD